MERLNKVTSFLGRAVAIMIGIVPLALLVLGIWAVWTSPPPTPAQQMARQQSEAAEQAARRERDEFKRLLCRVAAACKKYSEARLECATAGNFKTCLRIKMGTDASYTGVCSGYDDGAPAVPLSPETPNAVECFFLTIGQ